MSTFSIFREFESVVLRDPGFLHDHVAYGIFETIEFVSYGHAATEKFDPPLFAPPGSGSFTFWSGHEPDSQSLPLRFSDWLTTVGLRRFIEIYSDYLVKAIQLIEHRNDSRLSSEAELDRLNFHEKLRRLHGSLGGDGIKLNNRYRLKLLSLNRARNCLEHQRGVVPEQNNSRNQLAVRWERIQSKGIPPTQEEPDVLRVEQKIITVSRKIPVGEQIIFSPIDFSQIGQTFANHAMLVTRVLDGLPIDGTISSMMKAKTS